VLILGIEGFRLDGATIQPDKMPTTELAYEFVFGEDGA
jgi:hypothetical protein